MPFEFVLPDLGEGITEDEIRDWKVKEGDIVEEHQIILEVETDKAVVEVPSPKKGKVAKIHKDEGEIAKVGETLMTIVEEGERIEERPKSVSVVGVLPEGGEIFATPAVRALAKEHGIKLETIKGSGPDGSITREDVLKASEKVKKLDDQYGAIERVEIKGLRRTIARNPIASQKMTAFVTGMDEADITELWGLREREKKASLDRGIHLTFLPFFIKAVQHALAEHPFLNASVDEEREDIIIKKYYNIFKGRVYPVNPGYNELMGLKAYHSITEIPETIDLAIIIRPAHEVAPLLKELNNKTKYAIIMSSGFAEIGYILSSR